MVSEVIMLRLFSILEYYFAEIAYKLACGTTYRNGNVPVFHIRCTSLQDAHSKMLSYNRRNPKPFLKWTMERFIEDSIKTVLNLSDHYFAKIQIHASEIDEMRIVRNHIAHRSNSTRYDYINLLRTLYGANPNLSIGAFLTSTSRNPISNISKYIRTSQIILAEITSG